MVDKGVGELAVRAARKILGRWLKKDKKMEPDELPDSLKIHQGVFVTIHSYPEGRLRGCIGYARPDITLAEALVDSAVSVCSDPRFESLKKEEMDDIVVEVSLLEEPKEIPGDPEERPQKIKIGKDGLIVEKPPLNGLLLPQVAVELDFSPEEFLQQTCLKASLPPDAWKNRKTKIYKFTAQVFREVEPAGRVVERDISK